MHSSAIITDNTEQNDPDFQAFQQQMQEKEQAKQIKESKLSEAKRQDLMYSRRKWRLQMKRAQMYLGLITFPSTGREVKNVDNPSLPQEPSHQRQGKSPDRSENAIPPNPGNFTPRSCTVFVCVDVEAYEFNQQQITEIGVSTLNSQDLVGLEPGRNAKAWVEKIHSRHFRIKEYAHRRNKVHVESCADDFNFGESEWISKKDAPSTIKSCFTTPHSVSGNQLTDPVDHKFVFVAHNATSDIAYLENIGYNPAEDIFDIIDTSDLANASGRESKQSSLSTLLLRYGIAAKYLHNAGNDAYYTLRVMLAMAVNNFQDKRSPEDWADEKAKRIKEAGEAAKAKAEAKAALDMEGWSTSENDDVPGSALVPVREQRPKRERESANRDSYGGRADRGSRGGRGGGRGETGGRGGAKPGPKNVFFVRRQDYEANFPLPSTRTPATIHPPPSYQTQPAKAIHPGAKTATHTPPTLDQPSIPLSHRPLIGFVPAGYKPPVPPSGTARAENGPLSDQINHPSPKFHPSPPTYGHGYKPKSNRTGAGPSTRTVE